MQNKHRLIAAAALAISTAGGLMMWSQRDRVAPPASIADELPRHALFLNEGRLCLKDNSEPYTGIVYEQTVDGQRLSQLTVHEGILQGTARGWYENGTREVEEHFVNGVSDGLRKRWHANGKLKNEATIVGGELHGSYTQWHDDGSMAARMNMVNGKGEGLCEAWYPGGAPKAKLMLAAGQPVSKEYFPAPAASAAPTTSNEIVEASGE